MKGRKGLADARRKTTGPPPDETRDSLLGGTLSLLQGKQGYRVSLDAVLLARFAKVRGAQEILDLGCGNGPIALMLAILHPQARITGLEAQRAMVQRAQKNTELNRLRERVAIIPGDVRFIKRHFLPASFDAVVSNPPYGAARSGRINPDTEKGVARHEILAKLGDFLRAGAYVLRRGGKYAVVFPAPRAIDVLFEMRQSGLEPKRLRWVHSRAGNAASLVLVEAAKEGGTELHVAPPLMIYGEDGKYTAEVKEMLGA
jgi:tRNA1Val (adenine37-N6)-methyltransferase